MFAPPPTTTPAPTTQPSEPAPQAREEPKPAPPPPTTAANPITRVPVTFPLAAINRGIESGVVRARLTINAAGGVTEVNILSADPPQIFNRAATVALEAWKFNPGADKRAYEVEIEFKR
jgi:protein TonB